MNARFRIDRTGMFRGDKIVRIFRTERTPDGRKVGAEMRLEREWFTNMDAERRRLIRLVSGCQIQSFLERENVRPTNGGGE